MKRNCDVMPRLRAVV